MQQTAPDQELPGVFEDVRFLFDGQVWSTMKGEKLFIVQPSPTAGLWHRHMFDPATGIHDSTKNPETPEETARGLRNVRLFGCEDWRANAVDLGALGI